MELFCLGCMYGVFRLCNPLYVMVWCVLMRFL